jgi:hypothetical protein
MLDSVCWWSLSPYSLFPVLCSPSVSRLRLKAEFILARLKAEIVAAVSVGRGFYDRPVLASYNA